MATIELTPARWAQVDAVFEKAVKLPPEKRDRFVADSCGGDTELCNYILSLLQIDGGGEDVERTVVDALQSAISGALGQRDDMQGAALGPYRVVQTLGAGGMGVVYLAERADKQYEQLVAIKLGRHRLVDQSAQQRLRVERQILANLDHPNIARLLDGGTADDGTPYIVMEYIDGVRIDTYCDRNRLTIDQRLALFWTICSAVHYAHQNLVIHRDIKPSNILVTDDGMPKLLDFGIAKLIDTEGTATEGLTRDGASVMTPENAAPEQVLGQPLTTAVDTYALGGLLYLLLTGVPMYGLAGKQPAEMARTICQKIPELPSQRLRQMIARARGGGDAGLNEQLDSIGKNRSTTVDRLSKRLRGDIDTIVSSALRKEPERRYRSVNQFAEDIRLHRQSLPIEARSESWGYRAGKFVRRHAAGVATAVLIVSMLAVFAIAMSIQNQRILAERDIAREVSTFLEEIFESPDPQNARGASVTAREILDVGASRIDDNLDEQPEVRGALMATMGRVYMNLGEYEQSTTMLQQSLDVLRRELDETDPNLLMTEVALAANLIRQADYDRALELLERSLPDIESTFGARSPEVAASLQQLAELHIKTSDYASAKQYARRSAAIYELYEDEPIDFAIAVNQLGKALQLSGDLTGGEVHLRQALDVLERNGGPDHPYLPYYLQNLGALLRSKGALEEADIVLARAISATRRIYGEDHDLLAGTLVNQGMLLHDMGRFGRAEEALRDALRIDRKVLGPGHPAVGYDLTSLGALLHDKGNLEDARATLEEALELYEAAYGGDNQYVGSALTELGAVLTSAGRAEEALALLERAVAIRKREYADDHAVLASTRAEYGNTLLSLGRLAEAEPLLLASHEVFRDQDGRRSRRVKAALVTLYESLGKPEVAEPFRPD